VEDVECEGVGYAVECCLETVYACDGSDGFCECDGCCVSLSGCCCDDVHVVSLEGGCVFWHGVYRCAWCDGGECAEVDGAHGAAGYAWEFCWPYRVCAYVEGAYLVVADVGVAGCFCILVDGCVWCGCGCG